MGNSQNQKSQEKMLEIIQEKLKNLPQESLQYEQSVLDSLKNISAIELQDKILTGQFNYEFVDIVKIFHQIKQQENNEHQAMTDVLWGVPIQQAQRLQLLQQSKKLNKINYPLAGFVFSIKDSNQLKDTDCTMGMWINVDKPYLKNTRTMELLIEKGAIITCKGNVPQLLFSMESYNNVYGPVRNPYNKERIAGGSSGGDACLVKLGLVNAGIGSDVAGSLRLPALACGVVGFKPTVNRISNDMLVAYFDQHEWGKKLSPRNGIIKATIGPITKTVEDSERLMEVLTNFNDYDRYCPQQKWTPQQIPKKVGYLKPLRKIPLSVSSERAYEIAKDALRKSNIEVVELDITPFFEDLLMACVSGFLMNQQMQDVMKGKIDIKEKLFSAFDNFTMAYKIPQCLLKLKIKQLEGKREQIFLKGFLLQYKENANFLDKRIRECFEQFYDLCKQKEVESFLIPGLTHPPVKHLQTNDSNIQAFYCFICNAFNLPSGVIPITHVKEDEQFYEDEFNDKYTKCFQDNIEGTEGLPMGVQIAALPWRDELCFSLMKIIEKEVRFEK